MTITTKEAERLAMILNRLDMDRNATAIRSLAAERDHLKKTAMRAAQRHEAAMARADKLEAENARLLEAVNAALTEETPMEDGLWSQEPIGPNETPAEAIKRLIKFRVDTGCIVERDALRAENERLRAALGEKE
jgi:hypothetical protein